MSKKASVLATTKQAFSTDPADWSWVERTVWSDRMLSALGNGVKGGKWYSLIDKVWRVSTLEAAWRRVRSNRGAGGVDGQSIKCFEARADVYLREISNELKSGSYIPQGVRRREIPKAGGKTRALGIPTVKDRVVQTALKLTIEPILEQLFEPSSYGFRPGRGCKEALREVDGLIRGGYPHAVDADIMGYFDHIPHDRLCEQLEQIIGDRRVLWLVRGWLSQEIVGEMESWTPIKGSPQGAVISPLLANLYLHPLDVRMRERGYRMVRYADDFVILCKSADVAAQALKEVRAWMSEAKLELHPEKTHVGNSLESDCGFDFLGYRFEIGKRWIRRSSLRAVRAKIKRMTRRSCGQSLSVVIARLNRMLRGWYNYFKHVRGWTLRTLDGYIRRRLRSILRKQQKRPGFGNTERDRREWPNHFFARAGLFTLYGAWSADRQSC